MSTSMTCAEMMLIMAPHPCISTSIPFPLSGNHFLLQRSELNALVDLHGQGLGGELHEDTVSIMKGAMAFTEKR